MNIFTSVEDRDLLEVVSWNRQDSPDTEVQQQQLFELPSRRTFLSTVPLSLLLSACSKDNEGGPLQAARPPLPQNFDEALARARRIAQKYGGRIFDFAPGNGESWVVFVAWQHIAEHTAGLQDLGLDLHRELYFELSGQEGCARQLPAQSELTPVLELIRLNEIAEGNANKSHEEIYGDFIVSHNPLAKGTPYGELFSRLHQSGVENIGLELISDLLYLHGFHEAARIQSAIAGRLQVSRQPSHPVIRPNAAQSEALRTMCKSLERIHKTALASELSGDGIFDSSRLFISIADGKVEIHRQGMHYFFRTFLPTFVNQVMARNMHRSKTAAQQLLEKMQCTGAQRALIVFGALHAQAGYGTDSIQKHLHGAGIGYMVFDPPHIVRARLTGRGGLKGY